ncbi:MAG: ORF6N domain-containing protein [Elusimicrobia bacterium]|nr:ORF6N domain-containing protein [Elusimicrobiota bacterium]
MKDLAPRDEIERLIYAVRGHRVILDSDLARVYGVSTGRLNEQVKRNLARFPQDFAFKLNSQEFQNLISQFAISSWGGRRKLPYVFTEHGAVMAANVLNSARAVQMSVFVVRAFVRMRSLMTERHELAKQLAALEKKLTRRLNTHETTIVDVLRRVMALLEPPPPLPDAPQRRIGFRSKAAGIERKELGRDRWIKSGKANESLDKA